MTRTFGAVLKESRLQAGMTQSELARATGMSVYTVVAYELERRSPADELVIRKLASSLKIDPARLLDAARLTFDVSVPTESRVRMSDLQVQAERYPWPCLMNNENVEVVGANQAARRLAGRDISTDLEPAGRHLLRLLLDDQLGSHLVNREDVLRKIASILKSDGVEPGGGAYGPRFMPALVEWLGQLDVPVREWLLRTWAETPGWEYGNRLAFPAVWNTGEGTELRFNCLVTPWCNLLGVWAFDWLPADGPCWEWLESHSTTDDCRSEPMWNERLKERRLAYGLSRQEVSVLTGVSESAVEKWEGGTRKPTRGHLSGLVRGVVMDGATAGLIADALGLDPIPSVAYRYLRGEVIHGRPELASLLVREVDPAHIRGEIETHAWPCLVLDAAGRVVAANSRASWLVDQAAGSGLGDSPEMLAVIGSSWFRAACSNWADCAPTLLEFPNTLLPRPHNPSPQALRFVRGQPDGERILAEMKRAAGVYEPEPGCRASTLVQWRADEFDLAFDCVVSSWNLWDPYVVIDLHPADGTTWNWLNRSK